MIDDQNKKFIINELKTEYAYDEEVIIQTNALTDVSLELYVNDKFVSTGISKDTETGTVWEYTFKMPKEDAKISFQVKDGFLFMFNLIL